MDKTIIAECIAEFGYGTAHYNEETNDCIHESYGTVKTVISNPEYWEQYDTGSESLAHDFDVRGSFDSFRLMAFDDGTRMTEQI